MRFPPSFLDEIRARVPLSVVVGRRVKLKKQGREWRGLSPFNQEKTPSFYVNDQKGFYHCFSSGKHGDQFGFLIETEGLSFPEAVERLAAEAGLPMPKMQEIPQEVHDERKELYEAHTEAQKFFAQTLHSKAGEKARQALQKRGTSAKIIEEFGIGYAPAERYALRDHLTGKGLSKKALITAGLLIENEDNAIAYDRFRDRIMFPIQDHKGRVIAFGGRAMAADAQAKYLNSPETPLFHKGSMVFNAHRARPAAHKAGTIYVVEGYFDVVAMHAAGIAHAVAPMGTALTEEQLTLLWRMAEEPVLCFDGDKAGLRAAYRALDLALPLISSDKRLRFIVLPEGQDPDDLYKNSGAPALKQAIENTKPLVDMLWQREVAHEPLTTPEARAGLEKRLRLLAQSIKDPSLAQHYQNEFRQRATAQFGAARGETNSQKYTRPYAPRDDRQRQPIASTLSQNTLRQHSSLKSREVAIILALLNKPELASKHAEKLSELHFANSDISSLQAALLDALANDQHTTEDLRSKIMAQNLEQSLQRLDAALSPAEWWARGEASLQDTEMGWKNALDLYEHSITLQKALREAERKLGEEPTEQNFQALADLKKRQQEIESDNTSAESFGLTSGRRSKKV